MTIQSLIERAVKSTFARSAPSKGSTATEKSRVLIIVQNLPVPLDRRVWLECLALKANGYRVSVICPKGPGDPTFQVIDGIAIYKYRPAPDANGLTGFAVEFVYSWLRTAALSIRVRREQGFDIIQACNPPDTFWALARIWRFKGVKFIFDQHDLNPELYLSRFGQPARLGGKLQLRGLRWLERRTYSTADRVISTNESYRRLAISRGGLPAAYVTVVRSGPDTQTMRPVYPPGFIRHGADNLLVYLGIMGPQDGVDTILHVADELIHRRGRTGLRVALLGFGDCLEQLKGKCTDMRLDGNVVFTGRADKAMIADYLSAADLGLCPDLKTPLNDVSTMNKTMEYMAYGLPSVSFDLVETRVSGADTVSYVPSGDTAAFADAVEELLDNPELRADRGVAARARVTNELDWRPQASRYVGVFNELTGSSSTGPVEGHTPAIPPKGRKFVDLDDRDELRRFIIQRTGPSRNENPNSCTSVA